MLICFLFLFTGIPLIPVCLGDTKKYKCIKKRSENEDESDRPRFYDSVYNSSLFNYVFFSLIRTPLPSFNFVASLMREGMSRKMKKEKRIRPKNRDNYMISHTQKM